MAVTASISRSPYPLPDVLRDYEEFMPGMADRVISEIQRQTEHRQSLERLTTGGNEKRLDAAQSNALSISVIGIAAAAIIAFWNTSVAIAVALAAIGGAPAATVISRWLGPPSRTD